MPNPGRYRWWLDVETINSWESSSANNRADLEGMASYFRRIGANVGIYSTPKQWDPLVGTVRATSPLYRLPDWIPGATTLSRAKKNCGLDPLRTGREYRDLWVMRRGDDGRCSWFEEWPFWPEHP